MRFNPRLNEGEYVFASVPDANAINWNDVVASIKEKEGLTVVISVEVAKRLKLSYDYVAAWVSLDLETELDAVGITAKFSNALADKGISCNVIAGYYHDHLFVADTDKNKALEVLSQLSL